MLGMLGRATGPGRRAWGVLHTYRRRAVAVDDVRWGPSGDKGRRYACSVPLDLVPEDVYVPAHVLVALLQIGDEVDRFAETRRFSTRTRKRGSGDAPLLRISHLLAFIPLSAGSWSRSSSNRSFISFRLFRSASLCDTRSSGERE